VATAPSTARTTMLRLPRRIPPPGSEPLRLAGALNGQVFDGDPIASPDACESTGGCGLQGQSPREEACAVNERWPAVQTATEAVASDPKQLGLDPACSLTIAM
jgi:hypothetical protein